MVRPRQARGGTCFGISDFIRIAVLQQSVISGKLGTRVRAETGDARHAILLVKRPFQESRRPGLVLNGQYFHRLERLFLEHATGDREGRRMIRE